MTLFKAGSLDDIRQAHIMVNELISFDDATSQTLIGWASTNQRQTVLDYCYNSIAVPIYQNSTHSLDLNMCGYGNTTILHWAIFCRQPQETIALLLQGGAKLNAV